MVSALHIEALPRSDSGLVSFPEPRIPDPEPRLWVSTGFCHLRGGRPAHGAPHVSAERNDVALVRRIALSERTDS